MTPIGEYVREGPSRELQRMERYTRRVKNLSYNNRLTDHRPCNTNAVRRTAAVTRQWRRAPALQAAEEFVEFVGGIEVGFEVAGGQTFAEIVEASSEEIECRRDNFFVG
jgi:hypothetical protein